MNELIIDYSLYAELCEDKNYFCKGDPLLVLNKVSEAVLKAMAEDGCYALNNVQVGVAYKNIIAPFLAYKVNEDKSITCAFYSHKEAKWISFCIYLKLASDGHCCDFDYTVSKDEWCYFVKPDGTLFPKMQEIIFLSVQFFIYFQLKLLTEMHTHCFLKGQKKTSTIIGNDVLPHKKRTNTKPIKIGDQIILHYENDGQRKYERHCDGWNVRGHYRHYKSGKIVFIKPFKKGSGTNESRYLL